MNCTKCECEKCIADSAAAGEAHSELVAVYEAAKLLPLNGHGGNCTCVWCALNAALARVDARRGGGGHYCKAPDCKICRHGVTS